MFYLTLVGVGVGSGKVLIYKQVNFNDLRPLIEAELKGQFVEGTMSITQTKLAGFDAYNAMGTEKQMAAPDTTNVSETWLLFEPHAILRIRIQSKDRQLFDNSVLSLKSLKIAPK